MKITVQWSGTDTDRADAQQAQNVLEDAGLREHVTYVIDGGQPSQKADFR